MTQAISAVPASLLRTRIGTLAMQYLKIQAALDTLTGSY
ncbi:CcdB family protein [Sphingomonas oligophenolica]|nr:CcdB family protein [Sphingomonas oligophenolica]